MALPAAMVLSGLPQEQFTGNLQAVFNHGTVLLRSPSSSSIASTYSSSSTSSSETSSESGFSSLSAETERSLDYFLDVIDKLEQRFQVLLENRNHENDEDENAEPKIMYQGRNLLDLAGNLKTGWEFQHATLQEGLDEQISRVEGVKIPPHRMEACKECGFEVPAHID